MVTAEFMTIAPLAVMFVFLMLWIISLGWTHIRLADASRESARMLARGESIAEARAVAQQFSPDHAKVTVTEDGGTVIVTVSVRSRMPVPFFTGIGARTLTSTSVAVQEEP